MTIVRDEGLVGAIGAFLEEAGARPTIAVSPALYARLCAFEGREAVQLNRCPLECGEDGPEDVVELFLRRHFGHGGKEMARKAVFRGSPEPEKAG